MKIVVLCKIEYKNCKVYALNFGTAFQRLFIFKNEIYQHHFFLKPNLFRHLLWFLNLREYPYTPEEIDTGKEIILNEAMESIDKLSDPNADAARRKVKRDEMAKRKKSNPKGECVWITQKNSDTGATRFLCMEHKKYAHYEEGKKPSHKT